MTVKKLIFSLAIPGLIMSLSLHGQERLKYQPPDTRILFIFDASQSMMGYWQKNRKIDIARKVMIHMIDSLEQLKNVKMALRLYGHQSTVPPQDCNDTKLEVPFGEDNASKIRQKLRFVIPKGTTPIAGSLEAGAGDFPPDCDNCRNIIILITDGIEACDRDPCEVSYDLQKQGIVLKPFVIGIGIDEGFKATFDCIGQYYNAIEEEKFGEVMEVVISQALNATTAQVNLLDINGNPTETNVNMTFYDHFSGKIMYNYIHTMNHRGKPDTLVLDHLVTYDVKIHTIPPVTIENDIEIPILPRLDLNNIDISQSHTTTIEIPRPGLLTLIKSSTGYGSIYLRKSNKEEEWVTNINPRTKIESLVLQPGTYRVVFRAQNAKQTLHTINKNVNIK